VNKGDIVLVTFPFTNLTGSKLRPAVVLYETEFDFTACFLTSQVEMIENSDILVKPSSENGLKVQSLIRVSKIATLDKHLAKGLLGTLEQHLIIELNAKLKKLFQL